MKNVLEVIVTTVEDAIIAEAGGADRLELCISMEEGGITPSLGKIKNVISAVSIPVHVMLRPHSNSYHYTVEDFSVMLDDLRVIQLFGARGVVLGGLTKENFIDNILLQDLLPHCEGLNVTFHRAFDEVEDQIEALHQLKKYPQIKQVLTSGGPGTALDNLIQIEALLYETSHERMHILAASGIDPKNVAQLLEIGVTNIHVGSGVRFGKSFHQPINIEMIRKIKQLMESYLT